MNRKSFAPIYVLGSEIKSLEGDHYLFNDPTKKITIRQQSDNQSIAITDKAHIMLHEDDSFRYDHDGSLSRISGPSRLKNPYEAAIAATILGRNMLEFETEPEEWQISYPQFVVVAKEIDGKIFEDELLPNFMGEDPWVDDSWDVVILINSGRNFYSRERVVRIYVRPNASEGCAIWLEQKLVEHLNLGKKPSHAFAHIAEQKFREQAEKDAKWKDWMEGTVLPEVEAELEAKANAKADKFFELIKNATNVILNIGGKKIIVHQGHVYKNSIQRSRALLYGNMLKEGIVDAIFAHFGNDRKMNANA